MALPETSILDGRVVVIGAGMTGYLTAAALAERGLKHITLVDSAPGPMPFEVARPYTQVVYEAGQRVLATLPGLEQRFRRAAVCQNVRVVRSIDAQGKDTTTHSTPPSGPVYWILKATLLEILDDYVRSTYPAVTILNSTSFVDVQTRPEDVSSKSKPGAPQLTHVLLAKGDAGSKDEVALPCDLLVACDGMKSRVRDVAKKNEEDIDSAHSMALFTAPTPSTGMSPKGLALGVRPIISAAGRPDEFAEPTMIYRFLGKEGAEDAFDIILLPVGAPEEERRARVGVICVPETHPLLAVKDAEEGLKLFERNFPQLRIRDLISVDEMRTFLETDARPFPEVQRPLSLVGRFRSGGGSIMFLGDAAHSFPPDTAQGIQSAFEDVRVFKQVLDAAAPSVTVHQVAKVYEGKRDKEIWALMKLCLFASPFQYGQSWAGQMRHRVDKNLRSGLSVIAPWLFQPNADTLIRQGLSYEEVTRRSRGTTRNLLLLGISIVTTPLIFAARASRD